MAPSWQNRSGEYDGITTNGVAFMRPVGVFESGVSPGEWREVTVSGHVRRMRAMRSARSPGVEVWEWDSVYACTVECFCMCFYFHYFTNRNCKVLCTNWCSFIAGICQSTLYYYACTHVCGFLYGQARCYFSLGKKRSAPALMFSQHALTILPHTVYESINYSVYHTCRCTWLLHHCMWAACYSKLSDF